MTKTNDQTGDNQELEALFDSILNQTAEETVAPKEKVSPPPAHNADEVMAAAMQKEKQAKPPSKKASKASAKKSSRVHATSTPIDAPKQLESIETDATRGNAIFKSIGHLTRQFHESIRELGFDQSMTRLATELPDARDRLNYVVKMTEQAAERVLNATDSAQPIQNKLGQEAAQLQEKWRTLFKTPLTPQEGGAQLKVLVETTEHFLKRVSTDSEQTNKYLMDIVMAQDFQDLTGQVIKKIIATTNDLENRLVEILVQYTPQEKREEMDLLQGPQIHNDEGRTDIVTDQQQVDDLLASLGF